MAYGSSPTPRLRQLVHASVAATPGTSQVLEALLMAGRRRNRAAEVTGLLLAWPERYLQCLEGPAPAIAETYARIAADPRHHSLVVILDEDVAGRSFAGWDMACAEAGDSPWLARSRAAWEDYKDLVEAPSPGFALMKRAWEERRVPEPASL